jgi:hypothetical protein
MAGTPDVRSISAEHREVRRGGPSGESARCQKLQNACAAVCFRDRPVVVADDLTAETRTEDAAGPRPSSRQYGVFGEENGKRGPWKGARMPAWLRVR